MPEQVRIGTRRSALAQWQAHFIEASLRRLHPGLEVELVFVTTEGDQQLDQPLPEIGGKGLFTTALEQALIQGSIDLAVHSLKDLPTEIDPAFVLGAVPERASAFDALVSKGHIYLADLPLGAVIGTSSLRRAAQIKTYRADLQVESIRGNVDSRLRKLHEPGSRFDALVLAAAGLDRLEYQAHITEIIDPALMLPAPGQGALGVQCRAADQRVMGLLQPLDHAATRSAAAAERAFLNRLEAGCSLPVSAYAQFEGSLLVLWGRVNGLAGEQMVEVQGQQQPDESPDALGRRLAEAALNQGADRLIAAVKAGL